MKVHIKRNLLLYEDKPYSVEIITSIEGQCECIDEIEFSIQNNESLEDFDFRNVRIGAYLINHGLGCDTDYDYDDELICDYYETTSYTKFRFCPICGDKIEFILDEECNKTELVLPLCKELKEVRKLRKSEKRFARVHDILDEIRTIMFS